jgi:hypothetical protein
VEERGRLQPAQKKDNLTLLNNLPATGGWSRAQVKPRVEGIPLLPDPSEDLNVIALGERAGI